MQEQKRLGAGDAEPDVLSEVTVGAVSVSNRKITERKAAPAVGPQGRRMSSRPTKLPVSSIKVGNRHRRDLGDIAGLAASSADVGLLHPVVITSDNTLIAGARRLEAARSIGWADVPVTVVDLAEIMKGEFAENTQRKQFTPSEMVAIAAVIEPLEREQARAREGAGHNQHTEPSEKFSKGSSGRALDKVATVAGISRPTLVKARAVVEAAEAEPERFRALVETMDETGRADRAFKQLQILRHQQEHSGRAEQGCTVDDLVTLAASGKRFSVIYADPPWPWRTWSGLGKIGSAPDNHYGTSPIDEIKALPVAPLAADDCVLLIWGTWPTLPDVLDVIEAWGFTYKTEAFVWIKQNANGEGLATGMGYWTRSNSEFVLLATKGSPKRIAEDVHQVIAAPVGEHSAKPEEARRRIERLLAGPYLELYGRNPVDGWTVWGNEIAPTNMAEAAS